MQSELIIILVSCIVDTRYSLAPICGAIGSVLIVITLSVTLVLIHDRKTGRTRSIP